MRLRYPELTLNNTLKPHPSAGWCMWNDSVKNEPLKHWICPQTVQTDRQGMVWMLDSTRFNVDGIALSTDNTCLYYCSLTGHKRYRIKTAALRDAALTEAQLAGQVETVGEIPAPGGLEIDAANNIYPISFENSALMRRTSAGKIETLVQDVRLQWPDTYSLVADNTFYGATSAIHKTASWNKGVGQPRAPFRIFKMALPK